MKGRCHIGLKFIRKEVEVGEDEAIVQILIGEVIDHLVEREVIEDTIEVEVLIEVVLSVEIIFVEE